MDCQGPIESLRFHVYVGIAYAAFLTFAMVGSHFTFIVLANGGTFVLVLGICLAIVCPLPAYWHQKHRPDRREASLAPLWVLPFGFTLPYVVNVCGRSKMPLQDFHLARLDQLMGINVPKIALWASHNPFGQVLNSTYPMLISILIPIAVIAPVLCGRWMAAREFVVANIVALFLGLTVFVFLPAVGPWYGYHLAASPVQQFCQNELLLLRTRGPLVTHAAGIVCFPSFHVIWAILCGRALWTYRLVRIPVILFTTMIVLSTMTTGWHYFTDVLGGLAIAYLSIQIAEKLTSSQELESSEILTQQAEVPTATQYA